MSETNSLQLPETLTLEERRGYYRNYKHLSELFGEELVDEGLLRFPISNLCDVRKAPIQEAMSNRRFPIPREWPGEKYLGRGWTHIHIPHPLDSSFTKVANCLCEHYLGPHQYQGNDEVKYITKPAMLKLFPWLEQFKLSIYYQFNGSNDEFYVALDKPIKDWCKSLYVPLVPFLAGDVDAIIKRNAEYFEWYTKGQPEDKRITWDDFKDDPVVIRFLELTKDNRYGNHQTT